MNRKSIGANLALMVAFTAVGITLFTDNVRTVQILGLFTCGAVFGASLAAIIGSLRSHGTKAGTQD